MKENKGNDEREIQLKCTQKHNKILSQKQLHKMVDNSRTDNNNDILNEENITIIPQ